MGRTGIDLTKCNNCLFRAVYNGRPVSGTVKVGEEWCNLIFDGGIVSVRVSGLLEDSGIADFEIIPRAPETYKDWQVGDIIGFEDENGEIDIIPEHLCRVIFRSGELVAIADNCEDADINGVYTCSQLYRECCRLVLTDIEQQIIEERKKAEWEPQDGDICYAISFNGYHDVFIYKDKENGRRTEYYAASATCVAGAVMDDDAIDVLRPAMEEEKQKLFNAMAKNGKRWNAEKKVVEDIPKPYEFKKGDPVLVRSNYGKEWKLAAYVELSSIPNAAFGMYGVTDGRLTIFYHYCIPYNKKTMHLLGTTENYKEE